MKKLDRAIVQMLLHDPFFGHLLLRLNLREAKGETDTLATNGKELIYSTEFVESLNEEELHGCLVHEVLHIALLHPTRIGKRNRLKFNHAADYEINNTLVKDFTQYTLPEGALIDSKYEGLIAETIYEMLPDVKSLPKFGGDVIEPTNGEGGQLTTEQLKEFEKELVDAITTAAMYAEQAGKGSRGTSRIIERVTPKVNWRDILTDKVKSKVLSDYSWYPPNQLYLAQGVHIPTLQGHGIGDVIVLIDTSGSLDNKALSRFMAEVSSILQDCNPDKITVIYNDVCIKRIEQFEPDDLPITANPVGGGGTCFKEAFAYIQHTQPDLAIVFTDGYVAIPEDPGVDVVWAINNKKITPYYGDIIRIDED